MTAYLKVSFDLGILARLNCKAFWPNKLNERCVYYFDKRLYRNLVSEAESNHLVENYILITK